MRTKISILLLMIAFALSATAQGTANFLEVVHLKNGSIVKGVITEQVPGKSVKIKTAEGSEFIYTLDQIERFSREEIKDAGQAGLHGMNKIFNGDYNKKDKGYFAEIDLMGNTTAAAVRVTQGYKAGKHGYFGLAIGLENVAINASERLPELSLNLVYAGDFFDKKVTPFYQIEAGYGFSLDRYGYNSDLLNGNVFMFNNKNNSVSNDAASTLNYGGPQGALALGVKIHTMKKVYFKVGLDARLTSNFSDSHNYIFDNANMITGTELVKELGINAGLGVRFSIGF